MSDVQRLSNLINECRKITGKNDKVRVIKKFADIQNLLKIIHNPYKKFNVTSKNVEKFEKNNSWSFTLNKVPSSLFTLLSVLSNGEFTGHDAIKLVLAFINKHQEYKGIIQKALDKDLKVKIGAKIINAAFPKLIPLFSCALSINVRDQSKFFESNKGKWCVSRKLDGIRFMTVCENGEFTFFSRSGHVFPKHIPELEPFSNIFSMVTENVVFDGEMVAFDDRTNEEHFSLANSILSPNAVTNAKRSVHMNEHQKLVYYVFDCIPLKTFQNGEGGPKWLERQKLLQKSIILSERVRILEQFSDTRSEELWKESEAKGWEGLIYRLSTSMYYGKRHKSLLKRKMQADEEYVIIDATSSEQMNPKTNQLETALEHAGITLTIDGSSKTVWVGGGFSWDEKVEFGKDPKQLIGTHITVQHNGVTVNSKGEHSLRHPRKKALFLTERKV